MISGWSVFSVSRCRSMLVATASGFTMREVADAFEKHALVASCEIRLKRFRFTRWIAEIRLSLDYERRSG
jgi:hypothetical protein